MEYTIVKLPRGVRQDAPCAVCDRLRSFSLGLEGDEQSRAGTFHGQGICDDCNLRYGLLDRGRISHDHLETIRSQERTAQTVWPFGDRR
jgi:hypothetical protein